MSNTTVRTATWENIGTDIVGATSVNEVLANAKLDYEVHKEKIKLESGIEIPNVVATVKDDGTPIGVVSNRYEICQNADAFDFVNYIDEDIEFIKAGETLTGMIYIIGVLPQINILGDAFTPHLIFQNGHNGRYALKTAIIPLRIACQNQFNYAFGESKNTINIKHNGLLQAKLYSAREVMRDTREYLDDLNKKAELYAGIKLTPVMANAVLNNLFPLKDDMSERQKNAVISQRERFLKAYNSEDNQNFKGCAFGMFNAYSDYLTHKEVKKVTKNAIENRFMAVTFNPDFAKFINIVNSTVGV